MTRVPCTPNLPAPVGPGDAAITFTSARWRYAAVVGSPQPRKGARQGRRRGEVSEFLKVVSFLSLLSTLSLSALSLFLRISVLSPFVMLITPAPIWGSKERRDVVEGRRPQVRPGKCRQGHYYPLR